MSSNNPKRPQTAFFYFSAENREKVRSSFEHDARPAEISKKLGEMWRNLDNEQKKVYQYIARDARDLYKKELGKSVVEDQDE